MGRRDMEEKRLDPEVLLHLAKEEAQRKKQGKLKIFFGYAAGVGKTYAMLQSAHMAMEEGKDVVAGYIEPHARPETMVLAEGMECLTTKEIPYKGIILKEFDLDAALIRKPQIILVDELAHTNAAGCRNIKRYQDIQELIKAGIDVYTTVNVQHIESLADIVASITGIVVHERIPDFVFDEADKVELVDIEPEELMERLKEGKIYRQQQAGRALDNFFSVENLTALREIALRRTADQVNQISEKSRERNPQSQYSTDEHILVCLSASPSNPKVIRAASRMAQAFHARFTAVYVEAPGQNLNDEDETRFRMNTHLAEQLGAKTITLYGGDITQQIADYARISGVSKIVLGRSYNKRRGFVKPVSFSQQLTELLPKLEIHLIPDTYEKEYRKAKIKRTIIKTRARKEKARDMLALVLIFAVVTGVAFLFEWCGFDEANIITVYILGILLTAYVTESQIYSFISALAGVLCFNFFFTSPYWSLMVDNPGYFVTFAIMFLSGFITAFLAKKVKTYGHQAVKRAWRTQTLLETSQKLQMVQDDAEIIEIVSGQLVKLLQRDIVYYPGNPKDCEKVEKYPIQENSQIGQLLTEEERAVAAWTFRNNKHAGAMTNTLPGAKGLYLAVRSEDYIYGVVGIRVGNKPLSSFDESLLNAMLNEAAMALEKERNVREKNKVTMQMKQEQLRANLLRSISHDLRTPLTSISGNSGVLMKRSKQLTEEQKQKLYEGIYDDSVWLYNLVENLLSITRIEEGKMKLRLQPEMVEEVIEESLKQVRRRLNHHEIKVELESEFLMAWMDAKLIMQVILNLVDNAIKYTQEGTTITIKAKKAGERIVIQVADNGDGVPDEMKEKVFDMFYSGNKTLADSRRSMGVGLSLCRSIVQAHDGNIKIYDNIPKGSIFSFDLKAEEVSEYGSRTEAVNC